MTSWVLRLLVANVVVFIVSLAAPAVNNAFAFVPFLVFSRPWTLVTYMFLHADMTHIFFNMLGLYFFGPRLEDHLGGSRFLGLYFISGITAAILSFFFSPFSAVIGASGAVYGVMLGFARYWPREKLYIWFVLPIEARWMVIIMTVLSLYGGFGGGQGNIAHFAHLGGFLGGFLCLKWFEWRSVVRQLRKDAPPKVCGSDMQKWARIQRERLHPVNRAVFDEIMVKINTAGAGSLNAEEIAFLDRFSPE